MKKQKRIFSFKIEKKFEKIRNHSEFDILTILVVEEQGAFV